MIQYTSHTAGDAVPIVPELTIIESCLHLEFVCLNRAAGICWHVLRSKGIPVTTSRSTDL